MRKHKRHLIPDVPNYGASEMTTDNPQVPWTDEQWARVNKVVQEEASRARVAATFLPLLGLLVGLAAPKVTHERAPAEGCAIATAGRP